MEDYKDGSWNRAWYNWDYNRTTNLIWVLGYYSKSNQKQPLLGIDASTGKIEHNYSINYNDYKNNFENNRVTTDTAFHFVSALSSGKVMMYGGARTTYNAKGLLFDPEHIIN